MELERGDARLRKVAILVILLTLAVGAGALLALPYWFETLRLRPAPQARQSLAAALVWSTAAICVTLLTAAAYAWRLGARARGASRFPPPGVRVIRDTVVLHGPAAGRRAKLLQALAVVLGACGVGLFVTALRLCSAL